MAAATGSHGVAAFGGDMLLEPSTIAMASQPMQITRQLSLLFSSWSANRTESRRRRRWKNELRPCAEQE
jgi:hypothetical protein